MGVKGGKVPHVFTLRDDDMRQKIAFKKNHKSGLSFMSFTRELGTMWTIFVVSAKEIVIY